MTLTTPGLRHSSLEAEDKCGGRDEIQFSEIGVRVTRVLGHAREKTETDLSHKKSNFPALQRQQSQAIGTHQSHGRRLGNRLKLPANVPVRKGRAADVDVEVAAIEVGDFQNASRDFSFYK
jgi:hypothetical protein